ncbi:MAG: hypothetical protein ACE5ER_06085 [Nitrospinaceae bacterium]
MARLNPEDEKQARETLRVLAEIKGKAELLTEHVESRRAALEEEIEEKIHEAISHAQDCLEKVYENIEPKLEKTIQAKLEEIHKQMESWKAEGKRIVRQEIDAKSDAMTQILLDGLETRIQERTGAFTGQMKKEVETLVQQQTESRFKEMKESLEKELESSRGLTLTALGVAGLGLVGAAVAMLI